MILMLKLKILTKPSFRILTKIQLHNLNQTSIPVLCSKSKQKASFMTKPQLQNLA